MTQEIKIEKKSSEVIQPETVEEASHAIRNKQDLSGAVLRSMKLDNLTAVGAILRKTDLTEADLSHGLFINPNFYRAALHKASINNTVILGGDLVKTSFKDANMCETALVSIDAQEASFEGTHLTNAGLINANLTDTNFTGADLTNARLVSLDVTGADFSGANLAGARAFNVDWSKAKIPPDQIPEPLLVLSRWTRSILIGGFIGAFALLLYAIYHKKRKSIL